MRPQGIHRPRLRETDRAQSFLRPVFMDQLIPPDHAARAIWELIGQMDLSRYYEPIKAVEGVAGRSALDPRELISLWVLGYSQGVGSAREISRLCDCDPAYQWMTGMQSVNYHSLAEFRVAHKEALDQLFVQLLGILTAERLVTLERVTQDGTKIKANAGKSSFRREARLKHCLEEAQQQVEAMGDPASEQLTRRRHKAQERAARERQARLEAAVRELAKIREEKKSADEEVRASTTDAEARVMKQSDGGFAPSFNTQICTDAKAGVVVGVNVTTAVNDLEQLEAGMDKVQENLGQVPPQVITDAGYTSRNNIVAMAERNIELVSPIGMIGTSSTTRAQSVGIAPEFYVDRFSYDAQRDQFECPAGKVLTLRRKEDKDGCTDFLYQGATVDCRSCPMKGQCCPKTKKGRVIRRRVEGKAVASFLERMQSQEGKTIYRQRSQIAEFVNAWIKEKFGLRQFHVRGLAKVTMEAVWACLTYNIKQWIRLCWKPRLVVAEQG